MKRYLLQGCFRSSESPEAVSISSHRFLLVFWHHTTATLTKRISDFFTVNTVRVLTDFQSPHYFIQKLIFVSYRLREAGFDDWNHPSAFEQTTEKKPTPKKVLPEWIRVLDALHWFVFVTKINLYKPRGKRSLYMPETRSTLFLRKYATGAKL